MDIESRVGEGIRAGLVVALLVSAAGSTVGCDSEEAAPIAAAQAALVSEPGCLAGELPRVDASASSTQIIPSGHTSGGPPTNAIDSHFNSLWFSDYTGVQWLRVDLGAPRTVSRVTITPGSSSATELQGSNDGVSFTTLSRIPGSDTGADVDVSGFQARVRYLRLYNPTGFLAVDDLIAYGDANVSCAPAPAAKAQVTRDCGFAGASVALGEGRYDLAQLGALGVRNDDLSAVRVEDGYRVSLFQDAGFAGFQVALASDTSCLVGVNAGRTDGRNWNDDVSSLVVAADLDNDGAVQLYADADFAGASQRLGAGVYTAKAGDLVRVADDSVSSLRVAPGYRVVVCSGDGAAGGSLGLCRLYGPGEHAYVGAELNDQISLVAVATARTPSAGDALLTARDANLGGTLETFGLGIYEAQRGELGGLGNDALSSLSVRDSVQVLVCEHDGLGRTDAGDLGLCRLYGQGQVDYVGAELNDRASLVLVGR